MYFEEQVKQINLEKKKQLENNQKVKERNVKTAIFNLRIFFSTKKKTEKREMQRMSCGPNQWQQNAHRPNSLNNVTTRSNSQESLRSRARSSTHVDFKRLPTKMRHGQKHFCYTGNFCGKRCYSKQQKKEKVFSKKIKKTVFFFERGISKKKKSKHDERTSFLFRCQMTEIQKIYSWRELNKCCVKKKGRVYLVWKNKI